jgi:putative iron-regulated protein
MSAKHLLIFKRRGGAACLPSYPPPFTLWILLALLFPALAFFPDVQASTNQPAHLAKLKHSVINNYADIVFLTYRDSVSTARHLKSVISEFLAEPSAESLFKARQAWIAARVPYSQTEAFRFYDGSIDALEGLINAWPIDENYIDYVSNNPDSGIINMPSEFPSITTDLIVSLNEKEGKQNISAGFHAIEFLLWGQDTNALTAGTRSWRDYTDNSKHGERRAK